MDRSSYYCLRVKDRSLVVVEMEVRLLSTASKQELPRHLLEAYARASH
jgi:hypothetical protein